MSDQVGISGLTADEEYLKAKTKFEAFKDEHLKDPNVRAAYEANRVRRELTSLRSARGILQREVAEQMKVGQPSISQFETETHDPRVSTLLRYAAAIGVSVDIVISPSGVCHDCGHPKHGVDDCGEVVGYDHINGDHECGCAGASARLSRMLFEARELIDMYGDVVASQTGKESEWVRRVRDDIDQYREDQGWSPHGFGGEDDAAHIEPA